MAREIFVDTSGFYAILVRSDDRHIAAKKLLADFQKRKRSFVTSDYVLDETATLLKVRGLTHVLGGLFQIMDATRACRTIFTDAERFRDVRTFFLKHADQAWSFTDCASFHLMRELQIRDALTKDSHFQEAGFRVLLD